MQVKRSLHVPMYQGNAEVIRAATTSFRTTLAGRIETIHEVERTLVVLDIPIQVSPATLIAAGRGRPVAFSFDEPPPFSRLKLEHPARVLGRQLRRFVE